MLEIFLFTVAETFQLSGRPGPVLVPGVPGKFGSLKLQVGSALHLVTPNGESIYTQLAGVELINYGARPRPAEISVPIALPGTLTKSQVPPGTKVFAVVTTAGAAATQA